MINPDWAKWIQRAIIKHFTTALSDHTVISETEDINKNDLDHWFEIRIDLHYKHLQGSNYSVKVMINILVIGAKKDNIYTCKVLTGLAASKFSDIVVLDDNDVYQYCLRDTDEVIDTYYGEIEDQANMEQATVEGNLEAIILG